MVNSNPLLNNVYIKFSRSKIHLDPIIYRTLYLIVLIVNVINMVKNAVKIPKRKSLIYINVQTLVQHFVEAALEVITTQNLLGLVSTGF